MFRDIGLRHIEPVAVYRLNANRVAVPTPPRKVKVILSSHHEQNTVLGEKKVLSEYAAWNGVYIDPSRPIDERKAASVLRAQGRIMNEHLHGENWREKLDDATEMVKYFDLKLWTARRADPQQDWRRVRVIPANELPPPPPTPQRRGRQGNE